MEKLSRFTIGFAAYIVISSIFMFQVRAWLIERCGENFILLSFKMVFLFVSVPVIVSAVRKNRQFLKASALFLIFSAAYFFSMIQPYISEKAHVLSYGLLGSLASRDILKDTPVSLRKIILITSFIFLVGFADETLQAFLPWRVCDARDVITNLLSGLLGFCVYFVYRVSKVEKEKTG